MPARDDVPYMTKQQDLQNSTLSRQSARKPAAIVRLFLWMCTSRNIDGLWVGAMKDKRHPALRRVEDALQLLKTHSPFHYARVLRSLTRVWVHLVGGFDAHYDRSLNACVLDERFILRETTTLEEIASTIVHEATHARLERWGIGYTEKERPRIEAICLRRELNFIAKLPHSEALNEQKARTLEWCNSGPDYFSDANFRQSIEAGEIETLRYLNVPGWLIRAVPKVRGMLSHARRLFHGFARPA
jgi:hypothetical protein